MIRLKTDNCVIYYLHPYCKKKLTRRCTDGTKRLIAVHHECVAMSMGTAEHGSSHRAAQSLMRAVARHTENLSCGIVTGIREKWRLENQPKQASQVT